MNRLETKFNMILNKSKRYWLILKEYENFIMCNNKCAVPSSNFYMYHPVYWRRCSCFGALIPGLLSKKCLKVRENLGTRENLKNWKNLKIWKKLKIWKNLKFKIGQVDPRDMLNNFCFHVYAQKSLFIAENCNAFFWTSTATATPDPVTLEFIELVPS